MYWKKVHEWNEVLLKNIKDNLSKLEELEKSTKWYEEDCVYRFYHHSFKVYSLQEKTVEIVTLLRSLAPEGIVDYIRETVKIEVSQFNDFFEIIFKEGTSKEFNLEHNKEWMKHTRPIVEAFFHANFFLKTAIKYGKSFEKAPELLPSDWAALLYFYNLR